MGEQTKPCIFRLWSWEVSLREQSWELPLVCTLKIKNPNRIRCFLVQKSMNFSGKWKLEGSYCLSKLSILRDLCSILVIMASALSASTNPPCPAILSLSLSRTSYRTNAREYRLPVGLAGSNFKLVTELIRLAQMITLIWDKKNTLSVPVLLSLVIGNTLWEVVSMFHLLHGKTWHLIKSRSIRLAFKNGFSYLFFLNRILPT